MTSFGHSKPCQKTIYIYASLSLIINLIKLMSINYAYNNKKNLTWIFMKGTECYMYILLMYYISLLLLPPDGFVLCYIGFLVLALWCFDDVVISPSPGMGRYTYPLL